MGDDSTSRFCAWERVQWTQAAHLALPLDTSNVGNTDAFGLAPLSLTPAQAGTWVGQRAQGASVNAYDAHLSIHSAGTHTECGAHVSDLPLRIDQVAPLTLEFARLLHVFPSIHGEDQIITRATLERAWGDASLPSNNPPVRAAVLRSRPLDATPHRRWSGTHPPFFAPDALGFLADQGVEHLVTDLPSVDPENDGGILAAHRRFFGFESGSDARWERATITELAWIPKTLAQGYGLLRLDVLAWPTDAAPSRPVFYPLCTS